VLFCVYDHWCDYYFDIISSFFIVDKTIIVNFLKCSLYGYTVRVANSIILLKRTPHPHVLSPSYKRVKYQIYAQKFKFYAVSLKIRVNRPIIKLDGKNIVCVLLQVFFTIIQFLSEL